MPPRRDNDFMDVDSDSDISILGNDALDTRGGKGKGKAKAGDKSKRDKGKGKGKAKDVVCPPTPLLLNPRS
jgi:transcription initiation factor TFIIH subunit 2